MELNDPVPPSEAAIVRLPDRLTIESVSTLTAAVRAAIDAPSGILVFSGADARTFCTGLALDAVGERGVEAAAFAALLTALRDAPKPTLAFVDGRAIGGGLGVAASCDWVVASSRATFALPELLWGMIPAMIWPVVTMRMGEGAARRWTVAAHAHSAADAHAAGLVDDLAAEGGERAAIRRGLRMLRRLDPAALRQLRHWASDCRGQSLGTALRTGAALTARMAASPAARARMAAFADGEAPWT